MTDQFLPDIDPLAGDLSAQIEKAAQASYDDLLAQIGQGTDPRMATEAVLRSFSGDYVTALTQAFGAVMQSSVTPESVLAMPVGDVTLSQRLYSHTKQTGNEVAAIVRQHAQGLHQAGELARSLYDGYNPKDGIQRPLEGAARADLPKALRELTANPGQRQELGQLYDQMQAQAARLKSPALKAGYMEALSAWEKGKGQEVLSKRLWVAQREKTRFMADRIAQTELARSYTDRVAAGIMADETITVVEVRLNPMHPLPDICDLHTKANLWGLGAGMYPKAKAPKPPFHPFCWCKLVTRPDKTAERAREREDAAREWLRSLPPAEAARVLGNRQRLDWVLGGADWEAVTQAGVRAEYRLKRVGVFSRQAEAVNPHAVRFVEAATESPRDKQPPLVLSVVSSAAVDRALAVGLNLSGKSLALDHDGVLHAMKGHSGPNERLRGQEPITAMDLAAFDRIFNTAELRTGNPPVARDGTKLIEGEALIDGWVYGFAARVRRLHVVPQTLFKREQKNRTA